MVAKAVDVEVPLLVSSPVFETWNTPIDLDIFNVKNSVSDAVKVNTTLSDKDCALVKTILF